MVNISRWHYITLVALLLCAVNCSANVVKQVTIHLKFDKTHKHATGMAKVQPHPGGEVKVTIVAPSGGWKIHDCKLSPTTGVSKSYGPQQDSSQKPKSSVTLTVTVAQAARYAPIAVATEGHLVHPGGHGGGKLPDFNAPVVHPAYVTVSQVNIAPAHVVGVNSEFTVDINAKANNLQKDTVVTWTDFSAIIKYSQQQPEDVGDPASYKDAPSYEWVNELALQGENDQHDTTAIGEGTLKLKKAGYYMIIGNATCTFTKPDGSDSSSSDHNSDDEIADNDNATVEAQAINAIATELTYGAASGSMYTIYKDDGSGAYPTPHWQDKSNPPDGDADDQGEHKSPVAYLRNSKMKVSITFSLKDGIVPSGAVKVRGQSSQGFNFDEKTGVINNSIISVSDLVCTKAFPNTIDFYNPLTISWEVSLDGGQTWDKAGKTSNKVYVLLGKPVSGVTLFHTLVYIGCKNAKGISSASQAISAIWREFTDRSVSRVDGTRLRYYGNWGTNNVSAAALLKEGDGQCGAWVRFLLGTYRVQGITGGSTITVIPNKDLNSPNGFIIKKWKFSVKDHSPPYPYMNYARYPYIQNDSFDWASGTEDPLPVPVVSDVIGIAGQGTSNPLSLFKNHVFVKIDGNTYYDPSYGSTYSSIQNLETRKIAGYLQYELVRANEGGILDFNGDGDKSDTNILVYRFYFRHNPSGNQLVAVQKNYP